MRKIGLTLLLVLSNPVQAYDAGLPTLDRWITPAPDSPYFATAAEACAWAAAGGYPGPREPVVFGQFWGHTCYIPTEPRSVVGYTYIHHYCPAGTMRNGAPWDYTKPDPGVVPATYCSCPANHEWVPEADACKPVQDRYHQPSSNNSCAAPAFGNPIHPLTGAKRQSVELARLSGLPIEAVYDTRRKIPAFDPATSSHAAAEFSTQPDASLGELWETSLHKRLVLGPLVNGVRQSIQASRGGGVWVTFSLNASGQYTAGAGINDRLVSTSVGWRYIDAAAQAEETYNDGRGLLTSVSYANGHTLDYSYSHSSTPTNIAPVSGLLVAVQDELGRKVQFQYEQPADTKLAPRIARIIDPLGQTTTLGYDGAGHLERITWPDGRVRQFLYENASLPWALTGIVDENASRLATYGYDPQGRAIDTQYAGGVGRYSASYASPPAKLVTETYDANAGVVWRDHTWRAPQGTVVTLPNGSTTSLQASHVVGALLLTSSTQPAGSGCAASTSYQTYDANGNIASRDDFNGHRSCFANDLSRNLNLVRVEGLSDTATCSTYLAGGVALPPGSRKTSTQWHPDWRLATKVAEPLKLTTYVYNGQPDPFAGGSPASCAADAPALPDGKPIAVLCKRVEQATLDANGSQGLAAPLDPAIASRTWSYHYNRRGQVLSETDPANNITSYGYYAIDGADYRKGDLESIKPPLVPSTQYPKYNAAGQVLQSIDASGVVTNYEYDARQRLLSTTVVTASGGIKTTYEWHPTGLLKKVVHPNASFVEYFYDDAHRLLSVKDQQGNSITYAYDAMGNRKAETVKDSGNALARQVARTFDALSRLQTLRPGAAP